MSSNIKNRLYNIICCSWLGLSTSRSPVKFFIIYLTANTCLGNNKIAPYSLCSFNSSYILLIVYIKPIRGWEYLEVLACELEDDVFVLRLDSLRPLSRLAFFWFGLTQLTNASTIFWTLNLFITSAFLLPNFTQIIGNNSDKRFETLLSLEATEGRT